MDVSIIIPIFDGEGWVTRAIRSALSQSNVALEIIAVDDGSTDETAQNLHTFG